MQYWAVPNTSILCYVNQSSTDPEKIGIQTIGESIYLSSAFENVSIDDQWITERAAPPNQLGILINRHDDGKKKVVLALERTDNSSLVGTFSLRYPSDDKAALRTIFYVGLDDLTYLGGRYSGLAISIIYSVLVVCLILASVLCRASTFAIHFLATHYLLGVLLYYNIPIHGVSALVTTSLLMLVPVTLISICAHNMKQSRAIYYSEQILMILVVALCCFSFDWPPIIIGLLHSCIVFGLFVVLKKREGVSDATAEAGLRSALFSIVCGWVLLSSLMYFPSEIGLRTFKHSDKVYASEVEEYPLRYWAFTLLLILSDVITAALDITFAFKNIVPVNIEEKGRSTEEIQEQYRADKN